MSVVDFKPGKKKLTAAEKKEKARAKKIYDSIKKSEKVGKSVEADIHTKEFLAKYGYEV